MRAHEITIVQKITNLVNSKQDFSYDIQNNSFETDKNYNYIVGTKNILTSNNPSLNYNLSILIKDSLMLYKDDYINDIIGGWLDKDTNIYYLDFCDKYHNLQNAIDMAKYFSQKSIYDIQNNRVINL